MAHRPAALIGSTGPVRVLRVIARLNVGGPARHVAALAELDARGFETLLAYGSVDEGEASMADLVAATGVRTVNIPELGRRIDGKADLAALSKLARACHGFDPDIVHTHTAKAGSLGRVTAAALRCGRRRPTIVHTFHGHVFDGYFGRVGSAAARWVERGLAALSNRIVVISARQQRDIVERYRIAPARKVRVIPLGLDLESLEQGGRREALRVELGAQSDEALIGIVGRLVPIKQHELFLGAGRRALAGGLRARLVVVGGGEREAELRALAAALGIADRVHFLGWRADLPDLYAGLDIVTLTSKNEGTPVTLIEAMAAGSAVAATDVGGVGDVVDHGRTGLLVPAGDEEALAASWIRLASDPVGRAAFGAAAQADVRRRFSKARLLDDIETMYRELSGRRA